MTNELKKALVKANTQKVKAVKATLTKLMPSCPSPSALRRLSSYPIIAGSDLDWDGKIVPVFKYPTIG
jgi:hypothetical protein